MIESLFEEVDLLEFGVQFERQERGFVKILNDFYHENGEYTLIAGKVKIPGCQGASKVEGKAAHGYEPYTDVVIKSRNRNYNISMKGTHAPSLAGGGKAGIERVFPGFMKKYLERAEVELKKKFKAGDPIPDVFFPISKSDLLTILRGDSKMGGPIDYMYIGPMDVGARQKQNELVINGELISLEMYVQRYPFYIRLRSRMGDQTFAPGERDQMGYPRILGKSLSSSYRGVRVVITNEKSRFGLLFHI